MEPIKVGVIGIGFSAGFHIESLRRLPHVEIVAISGSTLEKAQEAAARHGIPAAYGEYHELINDERVEVVHNCTPNVLHYEINEAVMLAGKDLLSEKPLAINAKESRKLRELAEQVDTVSGVCLNYRHFPLVVQAKSMLASGEYGKPHLVTGSYLQDWLLYKTDYSWRLEPEKNGPSRAMADIGSHWCDTLQFVLGSRIVSVMADLQSLYPRRSKPVGSVTTFGKAEHELTEELDIKTEDSGSVLVHFENGVSGAFTVSQVSAGRKNKLEFEISARDASLYWDQENPNKLWMGRRNKANHELMRDPSLLMPDAAALAHMPGGHEEGWPEGMKNLLIDFYNEVMRKRRGVEIEGTPMFATIAEGHHLMQIIDAVLESNLTRQWVHIRD
ncbi:MAG TPA: Gfo/Idh/MocA family oxidoreductase [Paenibacillus sp.]|uniref:Gfo/Idh/MocA family protein n=1 Tax=Paenibacillus sp. TaxID=58172 RepID=UPI002B7BBF5E|nr:Gfo/Idh/MocA family oxidoreductase [Paenibacillus sp.]HUC93903.1 Gfo/Idh/MocA family oxidoreductase [Paenibacillus sp.]